MEGSEGILVEVRGVEEEERMSADADFVRERAAFSVVLGGERQMDVARDVDRGDADERVQAGEGVDREGVEREGAAGDGELQPRLRNAGGARDVQRARGADYGRGEWRSAMVRTSSRWS